MATKVAREQIFQKAHVITHKIGLSDAPLGFKIRRASFQISKVPSKKSNLSLSQNGNFHKRSVDQIDGPWIPPFPFKNLNWFARPWIFASPFKNLA